jgi:hypothetical protein
MATPNQRLSSLLSQIQNCSLTEAGAREMEKLVQDVVAALEPLMGSKVPMLSIRANACRRGLETDVLFYLQQYWLTEDKVSRMSKLAQARSQACLLLEQVLNTAKR